MLLITGGAGFIGSNIVRRFSREGHNVVVCDRLGDDDIKWRNLIGSPIEAFIDIDGLADALPNLSGKVSAVVHMGAVSATTERDADKVMRSNFELSQRLWRWCASEGAQFIYASSAATYGGGELGFKDGNDLSDTEKLRPLNLYGWSKQLFDVWALRRHDADEPKPPLWAGLRFFNVYGPREGHKGSMMSIVCKNYELCAKGEPVKLFKSHREGIADGAQLRDFIHVDDCVKAVEWLLDAPSANGVFNIGTGRARSFRDLIAATYRACGQEERIEYVPMPETIRDKYQYFTEADLTNLRAAGFEHPFLSVEDGVDHYVSEYLSRPAHDR